MNEAPLLTIGSWFSRGWNTFKRSPKQIILGSVVIHFFILGPILIDRVLGVFWFSVFFVFAVGPALTVGWYSLCLRLVRGEKAKIIDLFSGFSRFGAAWMTNIRLNLIVIGGMFLFVIPGIIGFLKYGMSLFAIMDRQLSAREALGFSGRITKGYKRKLFVVGLIGGIISYMLGTLPSYFALQMQPPGDNMVPISWAGILVSSILSILVITPLFGATIAAAYDSLSYKKDSLEIVKDKKTSIWKTVLVIVGLFFVIMVGIQGINFWNNMSTASLRLQKAWASDFAEKVSQIEASGHIAPEQIASLKELVEFARNRETSFFGAGLSSIVGMGIIKDEQITDQENQAIYLVRDLLREKDGKIGFFGAVVFVKDNPTVIEILEEVGKNEGK